MTPALDAALAACDELRIGLGHVAGRVVWRTCDAGFPDDVRQALRDHRAELTALLKADPRPDPEYVRFIAKNLDTRELPFGIVPTVPGVWFGSRLFYRLTPAVLVALTDAVESQLGGLQPRPEYAAARATIDDYRTWVAAFYRPDQISRAARLRPGLPNVCRPPMI